MGINGLGLNMPLCGQITMGNMHEVWSFFCKHVCNRKVLYITVFTREKKVWELKLIPLEVFNASVI